MRRLSLFVVVAALAWSPGALAQGPAQAEVHFQRARQLYEEGDFNLALVEFKRAYEVSPSYRVLYNIAQVNIQLFNYAAARQALEQFLKDGGSDISEAKRGQAEADLKMLAGRTAFLSVSTKPAGASVAIDDLAPVRAPFLEPVMVNAGQRKLVVTREGYEPVTRVVTLAGGDRSDLAIELKPVPVAAPAVEHPVTVSRPSYVPAVVGWTAAGVFTVSAVVVGALYLGKESEIDDARDPATPVTPQQRENLESSADRLAVTADVLGLVALGCAAAGLYFTLRPPHAVERTALRPAPRGVAFSF